MSKKELRHKVQYRGITITNEHTSGCFIDGVFFEPNGTGPAKIFGSEKIAEYIRFVLSKLKSDKYQKPASQFHDIFFTAGGTKKHFALANKLMRQIAIKEVKFDLGWYNPRRYWEIKNMWRNWLIVKYTSKESFNFNDNEHVSIITKNEYLSLRPE